MSKVNEDWRGSFGSLRVPFEYKSIVLGFLGVAVFLGGVWGIDFVAKQFKPGKRGDEADAEYMARQAADRAAEDTVVEQFIWNQLPAKKSNLLRDDLKQTFRHDTGYLSFAGPLAFWFSFRVTPWPWQVAVFVWFVAVWALIGGAVTRVTAMRVARDESISFKEAFQYVWNNKLSYLLTPLVVIAFILVFIVCNVIAGLVGKIPLVGPFIYVLLFVLVLLSTLFVVLLGIGLVFGFHMISSSISTEGGDGLQAVINVFNYVYARPWQYILYMGLTIVSVVFLWWVGSLFVDLSLDTTLVTSDAKKYTFVYDADAANPHKVKIEPVSGKDREEWTDEERFSKVLGDWEKEMDKREEALDKAEDDDREATIKERKKDVEEWEEQKPRRFKRGLRQVRDYVERTLVAAENRKIEEHPMELSDVEGVPYKFAAVALFIAVAGLKRLVLGYAASYILSANTTMYFLLRREVDGTDFDEIVEKEESVEFGEEVFDEKKKAASGTSPAAPAAPAASSPPAEKPAAEGGAAPQAPQPPKPQDESKKEGGA